MSDVSFVLTRRELEFDETRRDVGIIQEIDVAPIVSPDDKDKQAVLAVSQPAPTQTYTVKLISRALVLRGVPAYLGKNDVTILEKDDVVIVEYLRENGRPYIVGTKSDVYQLDMLSGWVADPVQIGGRLLQTRAGNGIHFRSDGGVVILAGDVTRDTEGNIQTRNIGQFLILGGRQGKVKVDGKDVDIRFSLESKLGQSLKVDALGNVYILGPTLDFSSSYLKTSVAEDEIKEVGVDVDTDSERTGNQTVIVHKKGDYTIGEELSLAVGDVDDAASQARKTAKATVSVAKQMTVKIGKNCTATLKEDNGQPQIEFGTKDRKIVLTPDSIQIGSGTATQPLLLGNKVVSFLAGIYAWANAVGGAIGVPLAGFAPEAPTPTSLCNMKHKQSTG